MRGLSVVGLILFLGPLALSGCAVNKVIECNRVIKVANQVTADTYVLTDENNSKDPLSWLEAADALDAAAQEMQTLEVVDAQLQTYRAGFIQMYEAIAQATRTYSKSYQDLDREGVDAARAQLEQAVRREPELVNGINTYCMAS
ncbi:MAG: hypothetical protein F6J87_21700 [Spirulina sp. SIO3F2]|nr:hypothetical protein [Spirulina sp. SIO3F2]